MLHCTSISDPPDHSFRIPDRTTSTDSRRSLAADPRIEKTPGAVPEPQNAQRSRKCAFNTTNRNRSPNLTGATEGLDSNSTELRTRFRIMGMEPVNRPCCELVDEELTGASGNRSVKGAVRMPLPGFNKLKQFAASFTTRVDTLDSSHGCAPAPPQTSATRMPGRAPAPKRQKIDARPRGPDEKIEDTEQDAGSRTNRCGSQSSFAHSTSPGLHEFQTVEAFTKGTERSNRRSRRSQANRPPVGTGHFSRDGRPRTTESIDSFDELPLIPAETHHQPRKARLVSTTGSRAQPVFRDAADAQILTKTTRPSSRPRGPVKSKKRPSHEIDSDGDELVGEISREGAAQVDAGSTAMNSTKPDAPSLSRRGELRPTQWQSKSGANSVAADGVGVSAAVCFPTLRYNVGDGQSPCFLRPTAHRELRAFGDDGSKAEPYHWLKITAKAKSLAYHPESELVRVTQASDQASSTTIGGTMFLKLCSSAEASELVNWTRDTLGIPVEEKDKDKLNQMWDKASQQTTQARSQAEARRLSDGATARYPASIEEPGTADLVLPAKAPSSSRTLLRNQMRLSDQPQTPLPSRTGSSSAAEYTESRFFRPRPNVQQVQKSEAPNEPAISRWSEENRDWAKNWENPLIIERTTVDKEDIPRLDEGQCLNDNLIGYGLQFLFSRFKKRHPDLHKRAYLHNSFFYEKLKAGRGSINYDGVKSWTAKVDLLSYDYIIVPVNEHYHWWLAIICNPGKLDPDLRKPPVKAEGPSKEGKTDGASSDVEMTDVTEQRPPKSPTSLPAHNPCIVQSDIIDLVSDDKNASIDQTLRTKAKQPRKSKPGARTYSLEDPKIITLDSLGSTHPQGIAHLKKYLLAEFEHKRNKVITDLPPQLGMTATNIPEQNNFCDCGVYLLGYVQQFVENPDEFIRTLLRRERPDWDFSPSKLRNLWRDMIFLEKRMSQKTPRATPSKRTPKGSAEPSRNPSRETSQAISVSSGKRATQMDSTEQPTSTESAADPDIREVDAPTTNPAEEKPQYPSPGSTRSPLQQLPQQQSQDEDVVLLQPQDNDKVLPSIEEPDVEEILGPPPRKDDDEPKFIHRLPSSSKSRQEDEDALKEVPATTFYKSSSTVKTKPRPSTSRTAMSSPAAGQHRRRTAATTRPMAAAAAHTSSHFVVAGSSSSGSSSSPEMEPVVEKAEMVRHSDPIDLT